MTRPGNSNIVAGRVAVATQSKPNQPGPSSGPTALDAAARIMSEALEPRTQPKVAPTVPPRPVDLAESASIPAPGQREQAERRLERRIRAHLSRGELNVTLTDNRYTMISVRRENRGGKKYRVRLHHMFSQPSPTITRALARYIAYNDREASRLLGDYIDAHQDMVRTNGRQTFTPKLVTSGQVHDLKAIFDELNRCYFGSRIDARITWGQKIGKPRRRNSIKMGSYSVEDRLIRIHRSLDRPFVPRFFVEWVVYHEMLHQVHDIKVVNGRRRFHSREFLRDEAQFERYTEARTWERANLDALLTY